MRNNFILGLVPAVLLGLVSCSADSVPADMAEETVVEQFVIDETETEFAEPEELPQVADPVEKPKFVVALDGEGLRLIDSTSGSSRLLAFGMDRTAVETSISAHLGDVQERSSNDECGAGPMDFSQFANLTANFQDGAFVGWSAASGDGDSTLTTMSGVGVGKLRKQMAETIIFETFDDSSIGFEFYTGGDEPGGFSGLFESAAADAKITDFWAGTNCIFR
ncbi:hypothetical protein A8B75_00530 [Sphingomonadales bacterium EhC05]|nr:hypothetical protein A8B75_00530 [Sphingomonadales bacterium EhC05]